MLRFISFSILSLVLFSQLSAQSYTDKNGKTHLWGEAAMSDFQKDEYKEWYDKNYDDHDTELTKKDARYLRDVNVKIFIGTWCGDTKYLFPKFIKTWEAMGLSYENLEMIAVHNKDEFYKQGPNGETKGMNIHRVPTFVFEKQGKEIGRIVERVVFDLDTDIMAIAKELPYQENYKGVSILQDVFNEVPVDSLETKDVINGTYRKIRRKISGPGELNTYGYVLLAQNRMKEALLVFKLNRFIFPYNPNARDSFGEILFELGDLENAKIHYLESIRINPKNDHAFEQLALINEELEKEKDS